MGWGRTTSGRGKPPEGSVLLQGSGGGEKVTPGLSLPQEGVRVILGSGGQTWNRFPGEFGAEADETASCGTSRC